MSITKKKIQPQFFEAILSGKKKFELRLNDFDIKEGDTLVLDEWDPAKNKYTGRQIEKTASYVYKFKTDGLFWSEKEVNEKGLQIISFV